MVELRAKIDQPWTSAEPLKKTSERTLALQKLLANNPSLDDIFASLGLSDAQKQLVATRLVTYDLCPGIRSRAPIWVRKVRLEDALQNAHDSKTLEERSILAKSVLHDNGCAVANWNDEHSQRIWEVHQMEGEALVMDQELLNAKRATLTKDGLFTDQQATVLLYNMVCGKTFWWVVLLGIAGLFVARQQGLLSPKPSYVVTPPPQVVVAPTVEEAKKMVLQPWDIASSFLAQNRDYFIETDTISSKILPRNVTIDPWKRSSGWIVRWFENLSGLGSRVLYFNSPYRVDVWVTGKEIWQRNIQGTLDPNKSESMVTITGIIGSNIKNPVITHEQDRKQKDRWTWHNDTDLKKIESHAIAGMEQFIQQYLVPAALYSDQIANQGAVKLWEKLAAAVFGTALSVNPDFRGHTVKFMMDIEYEFPHRPNQLLDTDWYTSAIITSNFDGLAQPWSKRIVTVMVTANICDPQELRTNEQACQWNGQLVGSKVIGPEPLKN